MELAINDTDNEQHQNRDDGNGDYPIGSHPIEQRQRVSFNNTTIQGLSKKDLTYGPSPSEF